ncbi:MAG: redoxin domain-containing protein, partial [Gammaproteobacteria bacterium]
MAVESKAMPAGTALTPFTLPDVDGRSVNILGYKNNLLLVVFTCNHCPYAKASWPTLIDLQKRYAKDGFQAVAVNP